MYPSSSSAKLASIATFKLEPTAFGAIYNPRSISLFIPRLGPTSKPSPGTVSLSPASSIKSFLPTSIPLGKIIQRPPFKDVAPIQTLFSFNKGKNSL